MAAFNRTVARIAIVGTGLLGASLGLGLRAAGFGGIILGVGRRWSTLDRARAVGSIDEGSTDPADAAARSDLVVLATPLGAFADLLSAVATRDHEGLVLTDVGSTKQRVCADARRLLPDPGRFVGSHPMAGSEQQGPDAARAGLFAGRPCVVTPEPDTNAESLARVRCLWSLLGMTLIEMTPAEHDRKVAAISHLPHAVAALLVRLADERDALDVASTGFRDTTRVAGGDPPVWRDIFATNRADVVDAIDAFARLLTEFRTLLVDDDQAALLDLLRTIKQRRDAWGRDAAESTP